MMYAHLSFYISSEEGGWETCYGSTGSTGLFCFTHPPSSETKHSLRGIVGNRKVNADQTLEVQPCVISWVMPPISQPVRNVKFESPDLRREKWMSVSQSFLHSESMSFDVCSFCDVFVLWCFFSGTSTCASTNNFNDDVWRIHMRCTHSYNNIWILRCMYKIDAIENETAPRRLIGLYASLRICHLSSSLLALDVSEQC